MSDEIDLKAGIIGSKYDRLSYSHSYRYNLRHAPRAKSNNYSAFARVTYTLGAKTFFTLQTSMFDQNFKAGDGVHFDNLHDYARPQGNPRYDAESLFARGDVDSTEITRTTETINDRSITYFEGDEGRIYNSFTQSSSFYLTPIDFDLTSQVSRNHQFKLGFDVQMHRLRYYRHLVPSLIFRGPFVSTDDRGGFQDVDRYGYDYNWNKQALSLWIRPATHKKNPFWPRFTCRTRWNTTG